MLTKSFSRRKRSFPIRFVDWVKGSLREMALSRFPLALNFRGGQTGATGTAPERKSSDKQRFDEIWENCVVLLPYR